jgi:2-dehydro-3-deoxyphosphogluconate aldolase/(4S)-4-hydroxy-2-oxoglutarate aldolase
MNVPVFKTQPFIAILRGVRSEQLSPLVEAVVAAGWQTLEITLNTPGAPELIQETIRLARGRLTIGAGTVLNPEQLQTALQSGATFIVSPTLEEAVVKNCVAQGTPVFPGALTPKEIWNAWNLGATMVKVFPAKCFGPDYFKEIKGPFAEVKLLACSGVTPENLPAYHACGADGYAVGGSVFKKEWLEKGEYGLITQALKDYLNAYTEIIKPAKTTT